MKVLYYTIASLIVVSCTIPHKKTNEGNPTENNLSQRKYQPIDKRDITKIILLIADTSIIDPSHKELPPLIQIGSGAGFVDSSARPILKPTQEIILENSAKDTFLDIFNNYLKVPQDTTVGTSCFILYRHVFILYDAQGRISEQINLCLDCTKLDFLRRGAFIQFLDNNRSLFSLLIQNLKLTNAYVPEIL